VVESETFWMISGEHGSKMIFVLSGQINVRVLINKIARVDGNRIFHARDINKSYR
jgi:hypothetical protein